MQNEMIPQNIAAVMDEDLSLTHSPLPFPPGEANSIEHIAANQAVLNDNIASIMDVMNSTMKTISGISDEVQPMVDMLSKHPIFKMFGGK